MKCGLSTLLTQTIALISIVQSTHSLHNPLHLSWKRAPSQLHVRKRPRPLGGYRYSSVFLASNDDLNQNLSPIDDVGRRSFLKHSFAAISIFGLQGDIANARGLARFPCKEPLLNTYHFMRSGSSLLEEENIWSTNPLFLTNREAALSEFGESQVRNACKMLLSSGISPTVVRYSLAAACVDSANIVGEELKVGRDRLVPEFNYMDPRAIGRWDFAALNQTMEAVWAMDEKEAGPYGNGGRPPPNEDGTPAETLSDQVVRLTNLLSVLETLYSGDNVLLIFPDGTGPALLSCLIGGIPLNRVHEFNYQPGEVRCNVNYSSVTLMTSQTPPQSYYDTIKRGQDQLRYLREHPDENRNIKDLKFEEEERLEAAKKKNEETQKKKELESQRQKNEDGRAKISYNNSFNAEVGVVGAALLAGGIGISSSVLQPEQQNITEELDADGKNSQSEAGKMAEYDDTTEDASPNQLFDEDEYIKRQESDDTTVDGDKLIETQQSDFDYDDAWLGTITDILNENGGDELKET
eukprot:CCRYP_009100-RC/>CCRYP_009100-RC protein AED:0.04 eAED:0.04 QI:96/1/1/1/0.71/0.62/8/2625/521